MNDKVRVIGFCGKKESGKTEIAKVFEQYGYERLYFAKPLKELIASLIGGTVDDVNELKYGKKDWSFTVRNNDIIVLNQQTKIPNETLKEALLGKVFTNTRDMLQIIGTDVIRTHNNNWHVDKIREMIQDDKLYVLDDVRFNNECELIKSLGGDLWYVARPKIDNLSNHISENTLNWHDFDNIIVNDKTVDFIRHAVDIFLTYGYEKSMHLRNNEITKLKENAKYLSLYIEKKMDLIPMDFLLISRDLFTYNDRFTHIDTLDAVEAKETCLCVKIDKEREWERVRNTLEIEDIKAILVKTL